jgi:hypothetical protein
MNDIYFKNTGGGAEWNVAEKSEFKMDPNLPVGYITFSQPYTKVTEFGDDDGHNHEVHVYPTLEEVKKLRAALDRMIAGVET